MPRNILTILFALASAGVACSAFADMVSSGTGFAIANGSWVVTNFHVVEGCTIVNIPKIGSGIIKGTDPQNDIAIIEPPQPLSASLHFRTGHQLKLGEEIVVIGFPLRGLLSSTPTVTTGIVSSLAGIRDDRTRLQISAPVQVGNSGGPVLDRAGNVVGIVVSKLNVLRVAPLTGDVPQNVNFAINSSIVTPILDSYSIKYQVGGFDREKSVSEVVSAASPAVVAVECLARERSPAPAAFPAIPGPVAPSPQPWLGDYGAIAWDNETGKRGWSWNQSTAQRAAEVALSECGASGCKVVLRSGPAMCAAFATTEDGKYVGAASRKSRDAARLAAPANCQKGKAGGCIVRVTDCNK